MQRRIPQLHLAVVVTSFITTMIVLAAFLALSAASSTPAVKVSARGLHEPLTSTIPLLINEVYDSLNSANEWFELVNTSTVTNPSTIDLSAYSIYNKDRSPLGIQSLAALTTTLRLIAPGQHLPIGPAQLGTSALVGDGLDGAGDYLGLVNTASDVVVDLVNWGSVPPNPNWNGYSLFFNDFFFQNIPLMPAPDGSNSLSRYPDAVDTDSGLDWRSLPQSPGFANQLSTPTITPNTPTPTGVCLDAFESDNTRLTSREILQNSQQVHVLCLPTGEKDFDWVRFGAAANKVYIMQTQDLAASVDTVISLYNAAGQLLARNDDAVPGQGLNSRIEFVFGVAGTYFLEITDKSANGGAGFQYTVALISTGQLPPTVTTTPTPTLNPNAPTITPTPGICLDTYEPDGIPSEAGLLNIGTSQSHTFCPFGDVDWVRFFARAGKAYTLQTGNLSPGVDTYMYLFNGAATEILAQNDDSPTGGLAASINFYPLIDAWYTAQIKNSGEIGGQEFNYDLALSVVPGVPAQPYSATPEVPLPPQDTAVPGVSTPTRAAPGPPESTPTLGGGLPTPTPMPTTQALRSSQPELQPEPQENVWPFTAGAGEIDASTGANMQLPDVPLNAQIGPIDSTSLNAQSQMPSGVSQVAPVLFRVFYDRNLNASYDRPEGVRGIRVYFLNRDAGMTLSGQLVTSDLGTGNLMLPVTPQRIYVPYLGINIDLNKFPEREAHSLWLEPVKLPDTVP